MPKKYVYHPRTQITARQQASLDWLRKQVDLGKITRARIQDDTGLSQTNIWHIIAGKRVLNSRGVRVVVDYADTLRYGKPQAEPDPFAQLRMVASAATGRQREALMQIVNGLLQMYPKRRRPHGLKYKPRLSRG